MCTNKMIPTLAPINKLIYGRVVNLPNELQQIILHFACCHPCAVLVRNSAEYIKRFIKPPIHTFFDWNALFPHQQHNHHDHHPYFIHNGPSLVGPIVPMQPYNDAFWIPPPPPPPRKKKFQQNNLIKAQRKQQQRSQKSNNRLSKRQRR
jgi:hypothetical protein